MTGHPSAHSADEEHGIHLPPPSFAPSIIALGTVLISFGLLWSVLLIAGGLLLLVGGIVLWLIEDARGFVSRGEPSEGEGHGGH